MATTTLAIVDAILKEVYEDRVRDQLQSDTTLLTRIPQTSEGVTSEVGGKYVTFPVRVRRNHGIGARLENEALPVARSQRYSAARVSLAYLYGSIEMTGQTMELAEKNFQAFASAMTEEIEGLREGLSKDVNRQLYGTSTGILATANAAGSTTTFVCSNAEAIYLEEGMFVDIWDASVPGFMANGPFEITDIASTATTTTVTFTPAAGAITATGDTLHRDDSRNKEKIGLKQIISGTGTLFNIDPTVDGVWKSVVDANGGILRPLSEGLMVSLADKIRRRGGKTTAIFTNLPTRQQYFNLLQGQRRFAVTSAERDFEGGFRGLAFSTDKGDIPVVVDVDTQWHRMYFANEKELKLYQEADWGFMNRDGSNWQRVIGFDAYEARMFKYCQFATHRRNSHGVLDDIDHTTAL